MRSGVPPKASVREKITHELREFVVIAIYLFIFFTALSYFKATSLHAYGIDYAPFGLAAIKALIFAKFILIGRALHAGERFKSLPLIWPTLYKSLAFVALLAVLDVIEEAVVGLNSSANDLGLNRQHWRWDYRSGFCDQHHRSFDINSIFCFSRTGGNRRRAQSCSVVLHASPQASELIRLSVRYTQKAKSTRFHATPAPLLKIDICQRGDAFMSTPTTAADLKNAAS